VTAGAAEAEPDPRRWLALLTCCSALFVTLLDVSITNVALPSIGRATDATPAQLQWVVSGYTLAFGLVPVLAGRLGDDHGRRLMFQVGVGSFAATSLLAGLAPNAGVLIATRVLQGAAGGLINPQVSGLVQQLFPPRERGRAFGVLGTTVGVGTALGPVVGGAVIALGGPHLGWRLAFWLNVPVAAVVIVLARRLLPSDPTRGRHRLDFLGAGFLGGATFCVLFASVEYDALHDARLAALAIPAVVLLAAFVRRERRLTRLERDPLFDLRLFRVPSYTAGNVLAITFFPAMAGFPLVLALYYQQGLGYTALESGLGITAYAIGSGISAPLAGRIVSRVGRPLVLAGTVTWGAGAAVLAVLAGHGSGGHVALLFAPALFVMGIGTGAIITPNQALTLMEVDPVYGSTAGGMLQTSQRIGLSIGQAVVGSVFFASLGTGDYAHAFRMATLAGLGFIALAALVGFVDLVRGRTTRRSDQEPMALAQPPRM
jgi:EmrB/QacA subfamily drug resistance transporter